MIIRNLKLIRLLKNLSDKEFKLFKKFLQSPFHTTNPNMLLLYNYLSKYHPDYDSKRLTKEDIYNRIFPKSPFSATKFNKLIYDLAQLTEEFLVQLNLQSDQFQKQKLLTQTFGQRNMHDFFSKSTSSLFKYLDSLPVQDLYYHHHSAELQFNFYFHPLTTKNLFPDEKLLHLLDNVNHQYLLAACRLICELRTKEITINKSYDIPFLEELKDRLQHPGVKDNFLIRIYRSLLILYETQKLEDYNQLKHDLIENIHKLQKFDQSQLFAQILNYAIRQLNLGNTSFYKEALDLYKVALANKLVVENNRIDDAIFGNIISLGCHEKEFEWTSQFINEHQIYLDESSKADTVAFYTGVWHFHQENFDKAFNQLWDHPFSSLYQTKVRLKIIEIQYEKFLTDRSQYTLLNSQIEAFEKYLRRSDSIPPNKKEAQLNCILSIQRMAKAILKNKDLYQLKELLTKNIKERKKVMSKDWLLSKVNQLPLFDTKNGQPSTTSTVPIKECSQPSRKPVSSTL